MLPCTCIAFFLVLIAMFSEKPSQEHELKGMVGKKKGILYMYLVKAGFDPCEWKSLHLKMEEQQRILCIMGHDGAMIIYKFDDLDLFIGCSIKVGSH